LAHGRLPHLPIWPQVHDDLLELHSEHGKAESTPNPGG
jgi:hypothetical protein